MQNRCRLMMIQLINTTVRLINKKRDLNKYRCTGASIPLNTRKQTSPKYTNFTNLDSCP